MRGLSEEIVKENMESVTVENLVVHSVGNGKVILE